MLVRPRVGLVVWSGGMAGGGGREGARGGDVWPRWRASRRRSLPHARGGSDVGQQVTVPGHSRTVCLVRPPQPVGVSVTFSQPHIPTYTDGWMLLGVLACLFSSSLVLCVRVVFFIPNHAVIRLYGPLESPRRYSSPCQTDSRPTRGGKLLFPSSVPSTTPDVCVCVFESAGAVCSWL